MMLTNLRQQISPVFMIVLAGVFFALPCVLFGFPFYADDSVSQVIRYTSFSEHVLRGDLYPRWIPGLNGGLGGTDLYFQSPIPFYLTIIFKPLFIAAHSSWRELGAGVCAALIASGLTFFLWFKSHVERWPAALAAIIYVGLPYHVNIDVYSRGAYSELWTFAWMPLVLFAIDQIRKGSKFGVPGVAISYALSIASNLPATLIFSPLALVYALFPGRRELRYWLQIASGLLLGIALAAVYVVPLLALKRFTFLAEGSRGHYYYGNWFLFTKLNWSSIRAEIFWFSLEVFTLALLAFIVARNSSSKRTSMFWFGVAVISFFLMTPASSLLWSLSSTLQDVQFPWRFNIALTLSSAVLLGLALQVRTRSGMVLRIVLLLFVATWIYDLGRRAWYAYPTHYLDEAVVSERNRALQQRRSEPVYRPRWVVSLDENELLAQLQRLNKTPDARGVATAEEGVLVRVQRWDREFFLSVAAKQPTEISISQFYFPGWEATLDSNVRIDVNPSVPGGLVSFTVPEGEHGVSVKRVYTKPELIGMSVTAAALLIVILYLALVRRTRKSN